LLVWGAAPFNCVNATVLGVIGFDASLPQGVVGVFGRLRKICRFMSRCSSRVMVCGRYSDSLAISMVSAREERSRWVGMMERAE
jgi:hypothetical protein